MMSRVWVVFSGLLVFLAWDCLAKAGHCEKEQVKDGETNVFPICSTGNWDNSYIDISKFKSADVRWTTWRLYSTKNLGNTFMKWTQTDTYQTLFNDYINFTGYIRNSSYEHIKENFPEYYEKVMTEKTEDEPTWFDPDLPTLVVAHGNGGGFKLDQFIWALLSRVADRSENPQHYNIIGVRWGFGGYDTAAQVFAGIKTARMLMQLHRDNGLNLTSIHGIGFSYGGHVVNAMASELFFSGHGKIARLSLLDPGSIVKRYNVDKYRSYARSQIGALNKNFANFVDVYHSSTTGVGKERVGHMDIWLNGGIQPQVLREFPSRIGNAHKAAVWFYGHSMVNELWSEGTGDCFFYGWKCSDPKWKSFSFNNRAKSDTCGYGDKEKENVMVGHFTPCAKTGCEGNYLVFANDYPVSAQANYIAQCHDTNCKTYASKSPNWTCKTLEWTKAT